MVCGCFAFAAPADGFEGFEAELAAASRRRWLMARRSVEVCSLCTALHFAQRRFRPRMVFAASALAR